MKPTKKVLLASAFVAAGYGVAFQLGAPTFHIQRRAEQLADSAPPAAVAAAQSAPLNSLTDSRPLLVPEVQPDVRTLFDSDIEAAREPIDSDSQSAFELASVSAPPLSQSTSEGAVDAPVKARYGARANLRNEAPRPLVTQPRTPINIKDVPIPSANNLTSAHDGFGSAQPAVGTASSVWPAQLASGVASDAAVDGTTAPPAEAVPHALPYADPYAMPLAQLAETAQARSHIIVDGDSLAKLAERYLDDPQRANEIYELNRTVLSHPDVLPIGAEIAIPARSADALRSAEMRPQSLLTGPAAIHAASRGGLIPVRPIPASAGVMPRAQLARPIAAGQ